MNCGYCKSEILFLKPDGDKTGLYCKSCGRWLKWVDASERASVEKQLEKQKREIRLDGYDVERVMANYKKYKEKYKSLNDDIIYSKEHVSKSNNEMEKQAMYAKVLKLKELSFKIAAYEEIILILGLK